MAAINRPVSSGHIELHSGKDGIVAEVVDFCRQFIVAAFSPYRPELHYMRGPGPACAAKRSLKAH